MKPEAPKLLNLSKHFTAALILLCSQQVFGLAADRDQPINIQADSAFVDDQAGITIYTGKVTIDQGTLHITADEVKVIMSNREVVQIIASMEPGTDDLAHYEQLPDDGERLVSADARTITYFLQEERLHLAGKAQLQQTRNTFNGELLHYNLATGVVDLKGGSKKKGGRVNITLEPTRN